MSIIEIWYHMEKVGALSMTLQTELLLFVLFLTLAAIFAFLETAFTALRLFKVRELQVSVAKYKNLFISWENNPQRILISILIANNFAHVVTSVIISHLMQRYLGNLGLAVGIAMATTMILIFGEIIPKSLAKTHHEKIFGSFLWLVNLLYIIVYPMVTILLKIADFFFTQLGNPHILNRHDTVSEKEIEFLIDYSDKKGLMETEKTEMLQNVFSLGQTSVREVMVPVNQVISINVASSLENAMEILSKYRYSRLPVYEGVKEDNIVGIIHQKDIFDLVYRREQRPLKSLLHPILFVPETQKVNQLLSEFLHKQIHMAVVVNEYGTIDGIITLEDILEEIVGEIADEHEKVSAAIFPLENDGGWLIDGNADLEELEDTLHITFITENSITIGGFLAERLQHLPKKGERFFYEGYGFQIQQASSRKVLQVLVFKQEDTTKQDDKDLPQ